MRCFSKFGCWADPMAVRVLYPSIEDELVALSNELWCSPIMKRTHPEALYFKEEFHQQGKRSKALKYVVSS